MTNIVEDILNAIQLINDRHAAVDEHLVEGYLLITPEQQEEMTQRHRDTSLGDVLPTAWGIPCLTIRPGLPQAVGTKWMAINVGGQIYAFKKDGMIIQ